MSDQPTMIDDVRRAKELLDSESNSMEAHVAMLRKIQDDFLARQGLFASLPCNNAEVHSSVDGTKGSTS
jgi:hypothetical protein